MSLGRDGNLASRMMSMPACGSPTLLDVSDVETTIANADVQTAAA